VPAWKVPSGAGDQSIAANSTSRATHQSPTADTAYCIFNEEVFGQRAGRAAIADDAAGRGHGVHDHVIAGGKAHGVGTGRDDLAGRFVAERHAALPRRQPAQGDV
jgi:hypothetical protein